MTRMKVKPGHVRVAMNEGYLPIGTQRLILNPGDRSFAYGWLIPSEREEDSEAIRLVMRGGKLMIS